MAIAVLVTTHHVGFSRQVADWIPLLTTGRIEDRGYPLTGEVTERNGLHTLAFGSR